MLALICGQGALPRLIAESCTKPPLIACLAQFPPDDLAPDVEFRLETLGSFLEQLKELGTTQVCFAGAIRRPDIDQTFIDPATEALVPLIATALAQGDDGALMIVIEIFEQYGFMVVGVDHIAPELVPPVGVLTTRAPQPRDQEDAERAAAVLAAISPLDLGQACAVAGGHVLGVEAYGGTEWMLHSLTNRDAGWPQGGILFKAPKIGQDRRVDLPAIGLATCQQVKQAGLDGIVIDHGGVVVLDLAYVVAEANRLDLFIWVREDQL